MTRTPSEEFEQAVLANWAAYFRCPVETLLMPGTSRLAARRYAGERVVVLNHIAAHTFVEYDPTYTALFDRLAERLRPGETMFAVDLVRALGADLFEGQDVNLMHYLDPSDLLPHEPILPFTLRRLTLADAASMAALQGACTPEEVDDGFVEVNHDAAFGCFDESIPTRPRLVSAASGYLRAGFVDVGVLTDPAHRRQGLGTAVVAALSRWAVEQGRIAQYRANTTNPVSLALAASLGFKLFFHAESLWFAE